MKKFTVCFLVAVMVLAVSCAPALASNDEAIYALSEELYRRFPNVNAMKAQFKAEDYGDVTWDETEEPSPHDDTLMLKHARMTHPFFEIATTSYTYEGEEKFFLTYVKVEEAGFVDFLGIDKGSSKADVIKTFGEPDSADDEGLYYEDDDAGYINITFILDDDDDVWRMRYASYLD